MKLIFPALVIHVNPERVCRSFFTLTTVIIQYNSLTANSLALLYVVISCLEQCPCILKCMLFLLTGRAAFPSTAYRQQKMEKLEMKKSKMFFPNLKHVKNPYIGVFGN